VTAVEATIRQGFLRGGGAAAWLGAVPLPDGFVIGLLRLRPVGTSLVETMPVTITCRG